jgi:hypothetical protein
MCHWNGPEHLSGHESGCSVPTYPAASASLFTFDNEKTDLEPPQISDLIAEVLDHRAEAFQRSECLEPWPTFSFLGTGGSAWGWARYAALHLAERVHGKQSASLEWCTLVTRTSSSDLEFLLRCFLTFRIIPARIKGRKVFGFCYPIMKTHSPKFNSVRKTVT